MNPFEWTGPPFLLFYIALSVLTVIVMVTLRKSAEPAEPYPILDLADPYLIAYLRGKAQEAARVATLSLVDRGLLEADDDRLTARKGATKLVRRPIERAILQKFSVSAKATDVFEGTEIAEACEEFRGKLLAARAIPDDDVKQRRLRLFAGAVLLLVAVAIVKIAIGLSRDRPVLFLTVLAIGAPVVAGLLAFPSRTVAGERLLTDLRALYEGLKARADTLPAGGATNEVALLAAVFGLSALTAQDFGYMSRLYPRAAQTGSSCGTTSCGSSSSCGSSCGGGCGGGCGGCGG